MNRHDDRPPTPLEFSARTHRAFRRRQAIGWPAPNEESGMLIQSLRVVLQRRGLSDAVAEDVVALIGSEA